MCPSLQTTLYRLWLYLLFQLLGIWSRVNYANEAYWDFWANSYKANTFDRIFLTNLMLEFLVKDVGSTDKHILMQVQT